MRRDEATLLDIHVAGRRIAAFVDGVDKRAFAANAEKHWAVVSQLLVIGEAVTRLSDGFTASHPTIPWVRMAGMRNRLIHGYDKIEWGLVWQTATVSVPELLKYIEPLIPHPPPDEPAR